MFSYSIGLICVFGFYKIGAIHNDRRLSARLQICKPAWQHGIFRERDGSEPSLPQPAIFGGILSAAVERDGVRAGINYFGPLYVEVFCCESCGASMCPRDMARRVSVDRYVAPKFYGELTR